MASDTFSPAEKDQPDRLIRLGKSGILQACREYSDQIRRQTLELLMPATCRLCGQSVGQNMDFCQNCRLKLVESESLMQTACRRCGRPGGGLAASSNAGLPKHAGLPEPGDSLTRRPEENEPRSCQQSCRQCHSINLAFDACVALWTYHGLVREAVIASKFGSRIALSDALGRLLGERLVSSWQLTTPQLNERESLAERTDLPEIATAVPSHLWRRIQRGGGGCQTIMQVAVDRLRDHQIAIQPCKVLTTTRPIKKQAWLGETQRVANVSGAFRVRRHVMRSGHSPSIVNRHVLLVDDVMTTGATANEIARELKASGARRVTVAVVARACHE